MTTSVTVCLEAQLTAVLCHQLPESLEGHYFPERNVNGLSPRSDAQNLLGFISQTGV